MAQEYQQVENLNVKSNGETLHGLMPLIVLVIKASLDISNVY